MKVTFSSSFQMLPVKGSSAMRSASRRIAPIDMKIASTNHGDCAIGEEGPVVHVWERVKDILHEFDLTVVISNVLVIYFTTILYDATVSAWRVVRFTRTTGAESGSSGSVGFSGSSFAV